MTLGGSAAVQIRIPPQRSRRRRPQTLLLTNLLLLTVTFPTWSFSFLSIVSQRQHRRHPASDHWHWPQPSLSNARHRRRPSSPSNSESSSTSTTALMGIRGFRAWFESQFGDAMTPLPKDRSHSDSFDHVLIDMNQVRHPSTAVLTVSISSNCVAQVLFLAQHPAASCLFAQVSV